MFCLSIWDALEIMLLMCDENDIYYIYPDMLKVDHQGGKQKTISMLHILK